MAEQQTNSTGIEKWLQLARADGVGPVTFLRMINHFGTIDNALGASASQLRKVEGIGPKKAERIAASREKFDSAAEIALAGKLGVWIVNFADGRYPAVLKRIYDPPPVLYVKGSLSSSDNLSVSIVGSRRCSLYGQEQASRFAHLLSSSGFTIVSGMARGIDTAAHHGALSAAGRTIAVQGCGLANVFPPENKKLFGEIARSGACVSELPLAYEPLAENFPARNRIIAGFSLATIVIEAGLRSGALITARCAVENNREVMAVPGKVDSALSRGSHQLIKQGAKLVETIEDIIETLGYIGGQIKDHVIPAAEQAQEVIEAPHIDISQLKLSGPERIIYDCLEEGPIHMEQIIAESDLTAGDIQAGLVSLRLKGLVKQLPGNMFLKR